MWEGDIMARMTAKMKRFCEEYMIDLNATQAAIRAGYSPHTAKAIGTENLAKPAIRACIDKALAERSKRTGINADRVLLELARLGYANLTDVANLDEAALREGVSRDDTAAIQSIKVKRIPTENGDIIEREIKICDKKAPLELLGKHLGLFTDKLSISGELGVKVIDNIPEETDD
jgi:phage terminase small subunit